ncbi:MAG TPA: hypothetical protein VG871_18445 [Vicinamibacterales bacterium]|nr:hypothetical protein [Vicinamibacterales bacterium]
MKASSFIALPGIAAVVIVAAGTSVMLHPRSRAALAPAPVLYAGIPAEIINSAANALLADVKRRAADDDAVPPFARERIAWLTSEQRSGTLSITLLSHPDTANLSPDALMASGDVDGRQVIVISRPRLAAILAETGGLSQPFSRRQRNDFLLGLVHETVHLERRHVEPDPTLGDRLDEEERAWRTVDGRVVRPLLAHDEPMDPQFLDADRALRSCGDTPPCQPLRTLLAQSESGRR